MSLGGDHLHSAVWGRLEISYYILYTRTGGRTVVIQVNRGCQCVIPMLCRHLFRVRRCKNGVFGTHFGPAPKIEAKISSGSIGFAHYLLFGVKNTWVSGRWSLKPFSGNGGGWKNSATLGKM